VQLTVKLPRFLQRQITDDSLCTHKQRHSVGSSASSIIVNLLPSELSDFVLVFYVILVFCECVCLYFSFAEADSRRKRDNLCVLDLILVIQTS